VRANVKAPAQAVRRLAVRPQTRRASQLCPRILTLCHTKNEMLLSSSPPSHITTRMESLVHAIFLDIDGVLNSESLLQRLDDQHRQLGHTDPTRPKHETTCECYLLPCQIDREAVARLNRLVKETGAGGARGRSSTTVSSAAKSSGGLPQCGSRRATRSATSSSRLRWTRTRGSRSTRSANQ